MLLPKQSSRDRTVSAPVPASRRLGALDVLRFCAAMAVVVYHYTGIHGLPVVSGLGINDYRGTQSSLFPWLYPVSQYGFLSVEIFFVISGFVICMSGWGRGLGEFFVSRVIRLMPAYLAAVCLVEVAMALMPFPYHRTKILTGVTNLTMLQEPLGVPDADSVYWSLWVELRFYLLFAAVVALGVTYRRVVLFCVLWTVGSVIAIESNSELLQNLLVPAYSPYFVAGMAFYLMHRFRPTAQLWCIVGFSYILTLHLLQARVATVEGELKVKLSYSVAALVVTAGYAVVGAVAVGRLGWIRGRWTAAAGALTYPLYLVHEHTGTALIAELSRRHLSPGRCVAAAVAFSLLLAWLVHRLVELPVAPRLRRALLASLAEIRANSGPEGVAGPDQVPGPEPAAAAGPAADPEPAALSPVPGRLAVRLPIVRPGAVPVSDSRKSE
ncbi:MAG TPA: acyltransferase [Actinocrinis sp.]|nr:acyltransferase [Actinocrinis sp.]